MRQPLLRTYKPDFMKKQFRPKIKWASRGSGNLTPLSEYFYFPCGANDGADSKKLLTVKTCFFINEPSRENFIRHTPDIVSNNRPQLPGRKPARFKFRLRPQQHIPSIHLFQI